MSRRARIAVAAIGVAAVGVALFGAIYFLTRRNESNATDRSRQLAAVMASFRPWPRNIGDPTGSARIVLLLDSGNVDAAAWKVRLRPNLPADDVPGVDRIVKQTQTRFRLVTSRGRSYGLNFWQPFVVEWEPSRVYVVRGVGSHGYQVVSTSVDDATRNGSRLPKWVAPYG